ncbi:tyrosyl-tRNA synthetase [Rhodobium orientis]|uniref:Tyrosine--tRNA ligase n=1 Tax=Rhodobium orientis TaxID=34017 RepID=A0A327JRI8_9HYPH|nr:tyrosine--tRNA ligase [Rhodobium orientis]MBB4302628.1 tyrosyl-tRNA synthetase [Rhodobium orientis]MBK5951502.1 tyrosine--tRNA ligase [Rhodobium orientis]RAI29100.1 tyrosine--tRNA ligase [Rhodobium orientis]
MTEFSSEFLATLAERGFIHQCSDPQALDRCLTTETVSAYIGFDCTAPSLHVGSLVQIMMLRWLQKCGHRPIVLMGGGTTRVGDPSGKDESRKLLTPEAIEANKAGIRQVFTSFLTFGDGAGDAIMIDNADWLLGLGYVDFLRDVGRHVSVNQMIQRDAVRMRLEREQHLSFLEFNYMVLQAYDFVELFRRTGCRLQMGGSDQWGNILSGIDLGRRLAGAELFAVTTPLITTASGAKMGKTADGAVWLNADAKSPYEYWQFWRNTEDADIGRFLRLFTELPMDEVKRLEALEGSELNDAKKTLATEATAMLHGRAAAEAAAETARLTFEEGALAENLPSVDVAAADLQAGLGVLAAFVHAGLAASNGEVRRQVRSGGIRVNDSVVTDERGTLTMADVTGDGVVKLSVGKKRHVLLRPV